MGLWDIIVWCLFGFFVGGLARFLVPGRDPMGCIGTMVLGIVGSLLGGFLGHLLLGSGEEFTPAGLIGALIGAVLLLIAYRKLFGTRTEG